MTYYDDMISCEQPENADSSFTHLYALLENLCVPMSASKLAPPLHSYYVFGY